MTKRKKRHHKDPQYTTQKSKDEATRTSQKSGGAPEELWFLFHQWRLSCYSMLKILS